MSVSACVCVCVCLNLCMNFNMQLQLNYLSNYVPTAWSFENGCGICDDDLLFLDEGPVRLSPPHVSVLSSCGLSVSVCVFQGREDAPDIYWRLHRARHPLHGGVPGAPDDPQLPAVQAPSLHPQQRRTNRHAVSRTLDDPSLLCDNNSASVLDSMAIIGS